MMVCPRCGFSQPEDRFCANCGLNVATYVAKPKPMAQRLLSSPILYLGLAIVSAYALVWWVKQNPKAISDSTTRITEAAAPVAVSSNSAALYPKTENAEAQSETPPREDQPPAVTTSEVPTKEAQSTTAIHAEGTTNESAPVAKAPTQLEIQYFEVAREAWQVAQGEGKLVSESGGWRAYLFTQRDKVSSILNQGRRLPGGRSASGRPSSTLSTHFAQATTEPAQGLYVDISVIKIENNAAEFEVAAQLDLRHDATTETHSKGELLGQLQSGQVLVLSGWLPRKPLPESQAANWGATPVSAIYSPDFLEGQSEVLLVIDGK